MSSARIVTDSTARFPTPGFLDHYPVVVVPNVIRAARGSVEEKPEMKFAEVGHLFGPDQSPPVLEPPSVEQLTEVYQRLQQETDVILSIHTSAAVTECYQRARKATEPFLGRCDIQVVDSKTLSVGLGFLVEAAARAVERGEEPEEVVRIVRGMISRLYMVFFLHDLGYLERIDLVSRSQAILGNMLNIIPFITMEEGRIIPMEKVRSRPRALEKLIEFVAEFSELDELAILQDSAASRSETRWIIERLMALHPRLKYSVMDYGPSLGTLVGLDSVGIIVVESEEDSA